jgi:hypothetical protein
MRRHLPALVFALAAMAAAGCAAGDSEGLSKEVADLRAEVQRARKDNDKLAAQLAATEKRVRGLTEDVAHVQQTAGAKPVAVEIAAAPVAGAAPPAAASGAPPLPVEGVAIRTFLATDEGRKMIVEAIDADRVARNKEQARRQVDTSVDRFAKQANLTEDQAKRMKEIMHRQAEALSDVFANLRQLGPDASQQQRDELRQRDVARSEEIRKQADDSMKAVLNQTQYETYQQEQSKLRRGVQGAPAGANAGRRNNRGGAGGNGAGGGNDAGGAGAK